jgi:hypothetical protein
VEVHISCNRTDPPVGELWRAGVADPQGGGTDGAIQFSGWLGLLRALADTLGDPGDEGRARATS